VVSLKFGLQAGVKNKSLPPLRFARKNGNHVWFWWNCQFPVVYFAEHLMTLVYRKYCVVAAQALLAMPMLQAVAMHSFHIDSFVCMPHSMKLIVHAQLDLILLYESDRPILDRCWFLWLGFQLLAY